MSPLSEQLRPHSLEHVVGQDHLLGKEGWLSQVIRGKAPFSLLFWGPPGCGKTTLAKIYASSFKELRFFSFSAVYHSVTEIKKIIQEIKEHPLFRQQLMIFVDELHRYNKAQQDLFLPFLEDGTLILLGATTENPSFAINNALLSRLRVLALYPLESEALSQILERFQSKCKNLHLTEEAKRFLLKNADGDARHLINMLENLSTLKEDKAIDLPLLARMIQKKPPLYDKHEDSHYNLISALHKSVRGSDPDAALYWLCRMLQGGEEPLYLARRLIRMAVEDVGLADPEALSLTISAAETYERLGSPEGELALAQATVYLALAPKSNAIYTAFKDAKATAERTSSLPPPKIILNAPTKLMKEMDYGKGYIYDHDTEDGFSGQNYFPDQMKREDFYSPATRGFEREMQKRLEYFKKLRKEP